MDKSLSIITSITIFTTNSAKFIMEMDKLDKLHWTIYSIYQGNHIMYWQQIGLISDIGFYIL